MATLFNLLNLAVIPMLLAAPPANNRITEENKLTQVLQSMCGSKSQILYPEACHAPGSNRGDRACFLILDYIIQGCSNRTAELPAAKEIACPMQNLLPPTTFVQEGTGVIQFLQVDANCNASCTSHKDLCVHLLKLNDWLQMPKEVQSTTSPEKLHLKNPENEIITSIPAQSNKSVNQPPIVETGSNQPQKLPPHASQPNSPIVASPTKAAERTEAPPKPESPAPAKSLPAGLPSLTGGSSPAQPPSPAQQSSPADLQHGEVKGEKNEPNIDDFNEEQTDPVDPVLNGGRYNPEELEEGSEPDKIEKPRIDVPEPDDEGDDYTVVRSEQPKAGGVDGQKKIPNITTNGAFQDTPDSHFFFYFISFVSLSAVAYIAFHNKNKIFAIVLEGRRGRQSRKRPNSAGYRKLDTSLEEAMMSHPSRGPATHVIY